MIEKSFLLFYTVAFLVIVSLMQVLYLSNYNSMTEEDKKQKISFIKTVGLPDLALCTNCSYIRHRSLANIADIYSGVSQLREYSKLSFSYNHSTLLSNTPSRIIYEK